MEWLLGGVEQYLGTSSATLARLMAIPAELSSAGAWVEGSDGRSYLDCGGYSVFLLGHRHPVVVDAVRRQLETQPLSTRLLLNPVQIEAAEKLLAAAPPGLDRVAFLGGGTEAVELALKIGRAHGSVRLIAMEGGFHGKSLGALSATSAAKFRDPFLPLLAGTVHVPFDNPEALKRALAEGGPATVIVEPIQAEGGVRISRSGYLAAIERHCRDHGAVLIVDEIQTGLGRTGALWEVEREGVRPDVLVAGKALGGGVMPAAAVMASESVFAAFDRDPLLHTSTFGGNQLACAAVSATLDVIVDQNVVERSRTLGDRLLQRLTLLTDLFRLLLADIRGKGLLVGMEFREPRFAVEFLEEMLSNGVLVSYSIGSDRTVRLSPPAILVESELNFLIESIEASLQTIAGKMRT